MMAIRALLITSALLLQLLPATPAVDKSTCKAIWTFKLPCSEAVSALVGQLKTWNTQECYGIQENCLYEITDELPTHLGLSHTSLNTYKTTDISIYFVPPTGPAFCKMTALTTSMSPNGTMPNDFCLLYNLIYESGLIDKKDKDICTTSMCPSKESATCITEG